MQGKTFSVECAYFEQLESGDKIYFGGTIYEVQPSKTISGMDHLVAVSKDGNLIQFSPKSLCVTDVRFTG